MDLLICRRPSAGTHLSFAIDQESGYLNESGAVGSVKELDGDKRSILGMDGKSYENAQISGLMEALFTIR